MTIKLIKKDNRLFCLLRNNKESTNNNDAAAEELRKLVTETAEDEDTQSKMDAILAGLKDRDAQSE